MKKDNIDTDEVIIKVDFAENYSVFQQDEIQNAHWHHHQVTIFTCCLWYADDTESIVIVIDNLTHSKYLVWRFLNTILGKIRVKRQNINKICIFSDNCAAQFQSKYTLSTLCIYKSIYKLSSIEWNFLAASHGKSVVDGIGGTIKRVVWTAVKARSVLINNAVEFYIVARNKSSNINVLYVPEEDVESVKQFLSEKWENVVAVPNIRSLHYFSAVNEVTVIASKTAVSKGNELKVFTAAMMLMNR